MNAYRDSDPFSNSVPVHGILKILWSNYSYHQSGSKANIQIPPSQNQASNQDATMSSNKDVSIVKKPLKYLRFCTIISELVFFFFFIPFRSMCLKLHVRSLLAAGIGQLWSGITQIPGHKVTVYSVNLSYVA